VNRNDAFFGSIVAICVATFMSILVFNTSSISEANTSPIDGFRLENWGQLVRKYLKSRDTVGEYSEETLGNAFTMLSISLEGEHPRTAQYNGAAMIGETIRQVELYHRNWEVE